jgi:hypothetical protein
VEFVGSKGLADRLNMHFWLADDAPICYVGLRGPFLLEGISLPPRSGHTWPPVTEMVEVLYHASTGRLLVAAAGTFKPRPGFY